MYLHWTKEDARIFQLYAVGLHGRKYAKGNAGIRACFEDLDTIQLDPLPVLGRNQDLVIQARVNGTHPDQTLDLIHRERLGFEYWDKMLCIVPIRHFAMLRAFMNSGGEHWWQMREQRIAKKHPGAIEDVYQAVKRHGPLSSRELEELEIAQHEHRYWKTTKVANGALEILWNCGRLSISHRVKYRRYFDLTERVIPQAFLRKKMPSLKLLWSYWLKKRVCDVGLLPLGGDAEAWAFLWKARAARLPEKLVNEDELALVHVEGITTPFLAPEEAEKMLRIAQSAKFDGQAKFISPLDPLIWCRQAVKRLWDFEYTWEVYKPASKRRWGYYVLPILYGDKFVARFDGKYDRESKTLSVLAYYTEPGGLAYTHPKIGDALKRFLEYLGGSRFIVGEVDK